MIFSDIIARISDKVLVITKKKALGIYNSATKLFVQATKKLIQSLLKSHLASLSETHLSSQLSESLD